MRALHETADVDILKKSFNRLDDATARDAILIHGCPGASHTFRNLIPELACKCHVVALDLPGFGMTEQPARDASAPRFENITEVVGRRACADVCG
jgi:pimeloyl-ACP methyl ester carboxylesterase